MRFSQVVAFCKVVELGSFTRAAEALVVTQPAVSLHVRSLEQEFGVRLLSRQGAEVVATPAGQILYCYARAILDARDVAHREIAAMREGSRETLTLGASATGMAYHLPPLLKSFMDRQSSYEVLTRVDITDRVVQWAVDGRVDVALVWGPVDRPDLIEEHLGYDRLALVCPPDHPLAAGGEEGADSLAAYPFVLATQGSVTRRFVEGCLARVGVRPRVTAEFSTTADMKRAVVAGMGIAVVGLEAVKAELQAGRLREVQVKGLDLWRPVSLIAPRQRPLSRGAMILGGFLAQELHLSACAPGRNGAAGKGRISSVRGPSPGRGRRRDPGPARCPTVFAGPPGPGRSAPGPPDPGSATAARGLLGEVMGRGRRLLVDVAGTVLCPWRGGVRVDVSHCLSPEPCVCFGAVQHVREGVSLICRHPGRRVDPAAAVDGGGAAVRQAVPPSPLSGASGGSHP